MARYLIPGDVTIRSVKAGDARKRLNDGDGLYLRLFVKGGSHGWRLDYSHQGIRKTLSLGTYPDTGLAAARKKADDARRLVGEGVDPSDVRKAAKVKLATERVESEREARGEPPAGSFESVAREWLQEVHRSKVGDKYFERTRLRLQQEIFPWLGRRQIDSIEPPEILACLRRVLARGAVETAHKTKQACGKVFRYGIAAGFCKRDVTADLRDAMPVVATKHYSAVVDPKRVGELLRAIDVYKGFGITRAALALAPLLFQRPGELRCAEWTEIDLTKAMWTIPSDRMKRTKQGKAAGPDHLVPLSRQAVAILQDELQPLSGGGRYVFPSPRSASRPMSDAAVLAALRRMGFPKDEMTGHGFRAMARTMLAERLEISDNVIEAQLAHSVRDSLGRAYNRTEYLAQRVSMMQTWADYLDGLRVDGDVAAQI